MQVDVAESDGATVATLSGVLDDSAQAAFEDTLHPLVVESGARIVLDLSGIPRATSLGLGQLVMLAARANTKGSTLVLAAPSPFVRSVLSVSRLDRFFDVVDSVDEARRRFG